MESMEFDTSPPPAIVLPQPAASDAAGLATALTPLVVTMPPADFWSRTAMGFQAFHMALRDWRQTWPAPDGRPAWSASALQTEPVRAPRPGSMRAVAAGIVQGATYWKHALMPTMALDQEVVGYVSVLNQKPNEDGDFTVDVVPLPAYAGILKYEGRYRPRRPLPSALIRSLYCKDGLDMALVSGAIHCEFKANALPSVQPFLLEVMRLVTLGHTPVVAIRGRWTFDPFHGGWVELHPARQARLISPTGAGFPRPLPLPADTIEGEDDEP
jgi:hypothetical protein